MADGDDPDDTKWGGDYASDHPEEDAYKTNWGGDYGDNSGNIYKTEGNEPSTPFGEPASRGGTGRPHKAPSRGQLKKAEANGEGSQEDQDFFKPSSSYSNRVGRGYQPGRRGGDGGSSPSWLRSNRNKLFVIGGAGSFGIIALILAITLIFPTLKLPQLAAEIEGYRMARLSRTFYKEASLLTADRAYLDAGNVTTADLVGKTPIGQAMSLYKPRRVVNNMKATNVLNFENDSSGRLQSVVVNGQKIAVPDYKVSLKPSDWLQNYKERVRFSGQITGAVNQTLTGSNYFVRSGVSKKLLRAYGINLQWWEKLGSDYKGLKQQAADELAFKQTEQKINTPDTGSVKTATLKQAGDDAKKALNSCLDTKSCIDKWIKTGQIPSEITDVITKDTTISATQQILGILSPTYAIMFPVCIAYDGSVNVAKTFLNAQNAAAMKSFFAVAAAADQRKKGDITLEALGAFNRQLGDIDQSYITQLNEGKPVDTSADISPQASRVGGYSIFNALFGNGTTGTVANKIANEACPLATDIKFAVALGAVQLAITLIPGGGEAEQGASQAAERGVVDVITSRIVNLVKTTEGRAAIKNTAKDYAASTVKVGAASEGLTYLSRMIVLAQMGAFINGTDTKDFANQADMGGIAYSNQMSQSQLFGRPLTNTESDHLALEDNSYIAQRRSSQSTYQKLFTLSNPNSALGSLAIKTSGTNFKTVAAALIHFPRLLASSFANKNNKEKGQSEAAAAPTDANYGMVQFGWSADEEKLIDNDPTYDPLVNAQILASNDPAQVAQIAQKYAPCFGYSADANGNLTYEPDNPDLQIGGLLGTDNAAIQRDDNGDVKPNDGNCAPANLSYDNRSLGADNDSRSHQPYDLVFRWRLDQSYQAVQAELNGIQDPTSSTPPPSGDTSGYQNPLRSINNLTAKRVDQGVDYGGSGPVYAIGNGTVKIISTNAGWPNGNFINYQISDGPATGKYVFVAENCVPDAALRVGQQVTTSTVICNMQDAYPYIETGWAAEPSAGTVALAHDVWGQSVDDENHYTAYGQNFSDLLQSLGAPPGTIKNGAEKLGSLPDGWPTW